MSWSFFFAQELSKFLGVLVFMPMFVIMKWEQSMRMLDAGGILLKTVIRNEAEADNVTENVISVADARERLRSNEWSELRDSAGKYYHRQWEVTEDSVSGYFARHG